MCTLLVALATADAHPEFAPATVNRYIKLDLVGPDELRLAYTTMVGPAPAAAWRRAADANADGKLDAAETRALGERMKKAVLGGLSLTVDGKAIAPAFDAPDVGLAGAEVAPSPFSVDLVARVPLPAGATHTVRFDDATPEPQLGESEVRVEESPTTRLLSSHRGPVGDEKETRFLFRGPKFSVLEDRSITFVYAASATASAASSSSRPSSATSQESSASSRGRAAWLVATALVAAVVVLLSLLLLLRRKRRG